MSFFLGRQPPTNGGVSFMNGGFEGGALAGVWKRALMLCKARGEGGDGR